MKIIDSHVHVGEYNITQPRVYGWMQIKSKDLHRYLHDCGIESAWLLSHPAMPHQYKLNGNYESLGFAEETEEHNLKPFCSVNGNTLGQLGRLVDKGCKGIGEIKTPLPIDDPEMLAIFREAGEFELPVVIHMNDKYCFDIYRLQNILPKISKTIIVLHGWGWWNHLQDGLVEKIVTENPNVYMDISANSGYKSLSLNWEQAKQFLERCSSQVLYGTDFPMITTYDGTQFGANRQHLNLVNALGLSQEALENVLYRNAERLVK